MLLWVGLGNPGPGHADNRHNIGFMAIEAIVECHGLGPWRRNFHGVAAEGRLGGTRLCALKPLTYMNDSGRAVAAAQRFYRIAADRITVFHDELDLAPGKLRVKLDGGSAGHNGLRSTDAHIGRDYQRVRLGIGHPGDKHLVTPYVLSDFAKADRPWLTALLDAVARAADRLAEGKPAEFMTKVALLVNPPSPRTDRGPETADGD